MYENVLIHGKHDDHMLTDVNGFHLNQLSFKQLWLFVVRMSGCNGVCVCFQYLKNCFQYKNVFSWKVLTWSKYLSPINSGHISEQTTSNFWNSFISIISFFTFSSSKSPWIKWHPFNYLILSHTGFIILISTLIRVGLSLGDCMRGAITWLQPPGAEPRSRTVWPGLRNLYFSCISSSLKAPRLR